MIKLSLALIVKASDDEAQSLDNLLSSVKGVFNETCITITGENKLIEKVAKKYNAKISHFDWCDDFAKARNYNFSQCTGDWIVWFDADDIVRKSENIRKNIELADRNKVTALSTLYNYSHDTEGNVQDSHWKIQMVKAGHYEWRGMIHEDLLPVKEGKDARISDVIRVHTATKADSEASLLRNIKILTKAIKLEPEEPRHYFYSARCYLGTEEWQKVIESVDKYLTLSNWPEERYDAINMAGEAWMRLDKSDKAIETHQKAILELEDAPDAYIYKARNYIHKEEWHNAITNLEIASDRDKDAVNLKKSALYDHDLYVLSAICLMNLGMYQQAVNSAKKAYNKRHTEQSQEMLELAEQMLADENLTNTYRKLGETMLEEPERLQSLLETIPESIKDDPRILALTFAAYPPKEWSKDSIVWFCSRSLETWDGNSIKNGGIGGSETAVIELSKRQAAAGKEVTVYNSCDAPAGGKMIDGVLYRNYWEYNQEDIFNTIILWRSPNMVDDVKHAKEVIVDMHDVSNDTYFTPERLERIDKVHVKTKYHRNLYPSIPDEKIVVIGNGIDMDRFIGWDFKKTPTRFIYTSSANRGLENILDVWPEIRRRIPEAELHIFYGWNTFAEAHKSDPVQLEWMESMNKKMEQEGVINHDRVDQETLAKEMIKSSLWLYPTEFEEIHCITALEMQAAGVYPITTGFAALAETQQSGVKIAGDPKTKEWREKFIKAICLAVDTNPDIQDGYDYAKSCSWDNVAKLWI